MTQTEHEDARGGGFDPERMRRALRLNERVFGGTDIEAADWLGVGSGARALDAGCGVGGMALLLAGRVREVVAIDINADSVRETGDRLARAGGGASAVARVADLTALDEPDASFDLVWCGRVVHHLPDMLAGVRELARVTKPGGTVAIREGGFGFRVLPDEVGVGGFWFEDRLAAAGVGRFGRRNAHADAPYPFGWSQLLRDAGLADIRARTFAFDSLAPLSDDEQAWIEFHWRRWLTDDESRAQLGDEDAEALETLLDPESPHYAFARPDLHLRSATTVYAGTKP